MYVLKRGNFIFNCQFWYLTPLNYQRLLPIHKIMASYIFYGCNHKIPPYFLWDRDVAIQDNTNSFICLVAWGVIFFRNKVVRVLIVLHSYWWCLNIRCIRSVGWSAAIVILICSFAVWRSPVDLHCLLSKQQLSRRWRYPGLILAVGIHVHLC